MNALDGVSSSEGRIVFMTTNYIERLDPALIRPGRVDFKQLIGYATEHQMREIYLNFYPSEDANIRELANRFAKTLHESKQNFSPAELQGYLMFFKNQPEEAFKNINDLIKSKETSHLAK